MTYHAISKRAQLHFDRTAGALGAGGTHYYGYGHPGASGVGAVGVCTRPGLRPSCIVTALSAGPSVTVGRRAVVPAHRIAAVTWVPGPRYYRGNRPTAGSSVRHWLEDRA